MVGILIITIATMAFAAPPNAPGQNTVVLVGLTDSNTIASRNGFESQMFDKEGCENYCRERFGWRSGYNTGTAQLFAQCVAECNNRFWADFERRSERLERETGSGNGNSGRSYVP